MAKDRNLKSFAIVNRKNSTPAELTVWKMLRNNQFGVKFKRQFQIDRYIVDFVCIDLKLVIECDGGQHDDDKEKDKLRTGFLNSLGYKVIRFWNNEILKNEEGVYLSLQNMVEERKRLASPSPQPSPQEGRGRTN
ncbi:very-short-patch-repair endonuclease [Elusimicrobium simillimum]|uniref:endonuclease domain-containing protein n=1 Tax=Elusimicrobium simillimum TaxID=3143438 RepID=UPI003C702A3D